MSTQRIYKCLDKFSFEGNNGYSLVPLRMEDKYLIMQWRNEQLYHLRQPASLTQIDQDLYFNTTVAQLFEQEQPDQLLFSYLDRIKYALDMVDWYISIGMINTQRSRL